MGSGFELLTGVGGGGHRPEEDVFRSEPVGAPAQGTPGCPQVRIISPPQAATLCGTLHGRGAAMADAAPLRKQ